MKGCISCVHLLHPQNGKKGMCGCHRQPDIKVKVQSIECFIFHLMRIGCMLKTLGLDNANSIH